MCSSDLSAFLGSRSCNHGVNFVSREDENGGVEAVSCVPCTPASSLGFEDLISEDE